MPRVENSSSGVWVLATKRSETVSSAFTDIPERPLPPRRWAR